MSSTPKEALYASAHRLYDLGKYKESAALFVEILLADPYDAKSWMGLASSRQMNQQFQEAAHAWSIVCVLNDEDPLPHFHAAECFLSLNDQVEAFKALLAAESRLKKDENSMQLRQKIQLYREKYA